VEEHSHGRAACGGIDKVAIKMCMKTANALMKMRTFEQLVAQLVYTPLINLVLQLLRLRPNNYLLVKDGILIGITNLGRMTTTLKSTSNLQLKGKLTIRFNFCLVPLVFEDALVANTASSN
jgi:hypothetical protein